MPNTIKATKSNIKTLVGNVPIYLKCPIKNIIDVVQRVKLKKTQCSSPEQGACSLHQVNTSFI